MVCFLSGNRNKRLSNIVGPEDMQYLQRCHHKDHKPVTKHQNFCLKIRKNPTLIRTYPECWHNTHRYKQNNPTTYPSNKCMYVYDIQH